MTPDITTPEARRIRRWVNRLAQLLALAGPEPDPDDWYRAGNCICEICGDDYHHHAVDPRDPWLTLLCDGSRVKL